MVAFQPAVRSRCGQKMRQMPLAVAQTRPLSSSSSPSAKATLRPERTTLPWASKRAPAAAST